MQESKNTYEKYWGCCPIVACTNVLNSSAFYHEKLGFHSEPGEVSEQLGILWAGENKLFLVLNPQVAANARGQRIQLTYPAIDKMYALHKQNGLKFVQDIKTQDYGIRDYIVEDPVGYHLWYISHVETQYLPWLASINAASAS